MCPTPRISTVSQWYVPRHADNNLTTKPLVSILIPTMNSARVLPECLEGVRKQTWGNIETIVIDGHSKDATLDVAKKYGALTLEYGPEQDGPFQKKFGGPYQWNYGGAFAKGEYLYLLASD